MTLNQVRSALMIVCATVFLAAPLLAGEPTAPVTAVVLPAGRYSKVAVNEMGREASRILKRSGVALRWRVGASAQAVNGLLIVVNLEGRCDMDGSPAVPAAGPLAWTHEVDGKMLPFTNLACDKLRSVVEVSALQKGQFQSNVLLGRAMGRVLSHEIYHIAADTSQHGQNGVTQAALRPSELTSGSIGLRDADAAAMERGLSRAR